MSFIVAVPREPSYKINFQIKLTVTEFIIYVLSCFGTWFGLSVVSLNPFALDWFKNKEKEEKPISARKETNEKGQLARQRSPPQYIPRNVEAQKAHRGGKDHQKDCAFCSYCFNTRNALREEIQNEIMSMASLMSATLGHSPKPGPKPGSRPSAFKDDFPPEYVSLAY